MVVSIRLEYLKSYNCARIICIRLEYLVSYDPVQKTPQKYKYKCTIYIILDLTWL